MIERGPIWWAKKYSLPIATMVVASSIIGAQNGIPAYPTEDFIAPDGNSLSTGSEDVQLRHIAAQLVSQGKDNSFEPTEKFTTELFTRVREATFQIELPITRDFKNICSSWLIDKQETSLSLITAAHCLPTNESFEYIRLFRPGLDNVGLWYPITSIQQDVEHDTAMITVDIPNGATIDADPLAWEENYQPTDASEMYLTVGFPYSFYMQGTGLNRYTILTHASVDRQAGAIFKTPESPEMWALRDIGSQGLSGGGVFRVDEYGNPVAIGIADAKESPLIETLFGAHIYVQPLHVAQFFENRVCTK